MTLGLNSQVENNRTTIKFMWHQNPQRDYGFKYIVTEGPILFGEFIETGDSLWDLTDLELLSAVSGKRSQDKVSNLVSPEDIFCFRSPATSQDYARIFFKYDRDNREIIGFSSLKESEKVRSFLLYKDVEFRMREPIDHLK